MPHPPWRDANAGMTNAGVDLTRQRTDCHHVVQLTHGIDGLFIHPRPEVCVRQRPQEVYWVLVAQPGFPLRIPFLLPRRSGQEGDMVRTTLTFTFHPADSGCMRAEICAVVLS